MRKSKAFFLPFLCELYQEVTNTKWEKVYLYRNKPANKWGRNYLISTSPFELMEVGIDQQ